MKSLKFCIVLFVLAGQFFFSSFDKREDYFIDVNKITEYEYTLANYKFNSPLSKVRYVFGSAGQKQIRVRVKDDSGDCSSQVSQYVVLN